MKKVILFSHESDIDGLGCVVLGKIAFDEMDYVLVSGVETLEQVFRSYMEQGKLDTYDWIYITDLFLYDPSLTMVSKSPFKDKIQVLDHHKKSLDDHMNRYSFTKIVEKDEKGKRCGTDLFYEYLKENHFIHKNQAIDEFVELTRLEDTWEWKNRGATGEKAHDLAILFNALGKEKYLSQMISKLINNSISFEFDKKEAALIQSKKDEYDRKLQSIMSSAEYFNDENHYKFGIVFADYEFRNELAEYVGKHKNPEGIKYLIIVAMNKGEFGQKSYRSIDENFDVNEVAVMHGGGGHPRAAAVNITEEQKLKISSLTKREALKYLADSSYVEKEG